MRWSTFLLGLILAALPLAGAAGPGNDRAIELRELSAELRTLEAAGDSSTRFTWWLPAKATRLILPFDGGVVIDPADAGLVDWMQRGSPWKLNELPVLGAEYGSTVLVVIVPWPHYASLVVEDDRLGVRFDFPAQREHATPMTLIATVRDRDVLQPAKVLREWRAMALDHGAIPPRVTLIEKTRQNPAVERLFGAPQFYLWGDAASPSLAQALHTAGIEHAVLLLSDLLAKNPKTALAHKANDLGYLVGPYDCYNEVHDPQAAEDNTWETAQFDQAAFARGRVLQVNGQGLTGFRGEGFSLSPTYAQKYLKSRVGALLDQARYSTWFVDCDATAEGIDDYSPLHPATRADDIAARRDRLRWIGTEMGQVVGSEGGSILFADLVAYGQGVHTPYLGHLDPAFKTETSPSYLGRYWPADQPEHFFKPVQLPPKLLRPYFDPTVRIPLYRAAIGDEVMATDHWTFDFFKLRDLRPIRELLALLYLEPPLYHLSVESWPKRRDAIIQFVSVWSPLHRKFAGAELRTFQYLSDDCQVQRTTYQAAAGETLSITVNFSPQVRGQLPPTSATIRTSDNREQIYRAEP